MKDRLDTPGTYSQMRQYGQTAQTALKDVKTCPTKAGASGEGSSVTTTVEQVLAREGDDPDFPVTIPPIIILPPPCASCVRSASASSASSLSLQYPLSVLPKHRAKRVNARTASEWNSDP